MLYKVHTLGSAGVIGSLRHDQTHSDTFEHLLLFNGMLIPISPSSDKSTYRLQPNTTILN